MIKYLIKDKYREETEFIRVHSQLEVQSLTVRKELWQSSRHQAGSRQEVGPD